MTGHRSSDLWALRATQRRVRHECADWEARIEAYAIALPLPPAALGLNGRVSPWERARLTHELRFAAKTRWGEASSWQRPMWDGPCWVEIHWFYRGSSVPDTASAIERCKAIIDGAQDAGILVDDTQVQGHAVERHRVREDPHVEIVIWRERPA